MPRWLRRKPRTPVVQVVVTTPTANADQVVAEVRRRLTWQARTTR